MKKTVLFILVLFYCLNIVAQHTYVFLGSYNGDAQKEGIAVYELKDDSLVKVAGVTGVRNPSFINLSPNGKFLYSVADSKTPNAGSVSSFAINGTSIQFLNKRSSHGENPVYVSVHKSGKWLVNANYTAGTMAVYPLLPNGMIASAVQTIKYSGGSINKARQEAPHIHAAVFSPDGRYLYLPDLGSDKIWCYRFNSAQSKPLQDAGAVNTVPGSGPRHLTFHPNGKYAYCIEEIAGYVSVYRYKHGRLDSLQRISTRGTESADIHVAPDGKYLYASNRSTDNNIAIFSIQKDGRLQFKTTVPTGGTHPRTFAIDPSGRFIVVANVTTNTATLLKRDVRTGMLKNTGVAVSMPSVSTVQIRRY